MDCAQNKTSAVQSVSWLRAFLETEKKGGAGEVSGGKVKACGAEVGIGGWGWGCRWDACRDKLWISVGV